MPTSSDEKMTKMTLNIPDRLHRAIKIEAALSGKTMRDLVVEKLSTPTTHHHDNDTPHHDNYDIDDVNTAIAQSLKEVALYQQGKIELQDARLFLSELKEI